MTTMAREGQTYMWKQSKSRTFHISGRMFVEGRMVDVAMCDPAIRLRGKSLELDEVQSPDLPNNLAGGVCIRCLKMIGVKPVHAVDVKLTPEQYDHLREYALDEVHADWDLSPQKLDIWKGILAALRDAQPQRDKA